LKKHSQNWGFTVACRSGYSISNAPFRCLLNSDTEVQPGALDLLIDWLKDNPDYRMAAPRLINPDGSVQKACMQLPGLFTALCYDTIWGKFIPGKWVNDRYHMKSFDHLSDKDVAQPPAACWMMRYKPDLALFDPRFRLYFSDVDICKYFKETKQKIRYISDAIVMHHLGQSAYQHPRRIELLFKDRLVYYNKHYRWAMPYIKMCVRWRAFEELWRARHDPEYKDQVKKMLKTILEAPVPERIESI